MFNLAPKGWFINGPYLKPGIQLVEFDDSLVELSEEEIKQLTGLSEKQKNLFIRLFSAIYNNQGYVNGHPQARLIRDDIWKTIAWNSAFEGLQQLGMEI